MSGPWTLPNSWEWTTFGQIATITGGGTPTTTDNRSFTQTGGIPWLTPADLTGYKEAYISRGRRNLSKEGYEVSSAKLLPVGTVLFTSRAPIGYCVIAANEITTNQGFKSLTLKESISGELIRHYLIWSKPYLESLASGTTFLELSGSKFAEATFPLPPLAEQTRIVVKLDGLSKKSAHARTELARIETLITRFKQAVLNKAFSGEFAGVKAKAYGLSSLVTLRTGPFGSAVHKSDYVLNGVPLVNPMHIVEGTIKINQNTSVSDDKARELSDFSLSTGDVVIARRGVMGRCAVVTPIEEGFLCGTGSMIIRPGTKLYPQYLQRYLSSPIVVSALEKAAVGTTMVNLNQSILLQQSIPLPSIEDQHEIVRRIESTFAKIDRLAVEAKRALELLGKLDEAILAKTFRGELVPQDENDEPASVLLKRIRAEREAAPITKVQRKKRDKIMNSAKDFLQAKLEEWPREGRTFQDLKHEFGGTYEDLKDAVFSFLSKENSSLYQAFDEQVSTMTIKKRF